MLYLNDKEEKVIGFFFTHSDEYEKKTMVLKWDDGSQVTAEFDSYIEDEEDCEMDDENYEEFFSFVFKSLQAKGNPPVFITQHNYFLVNYRNFPDEILVDGKKIN